MEKWNTNDGTENESEEATDKKKSQGMNFYW